MERPSSPTEGFRRSIGSRAGLYMPATCQNRLGQGRRRWMKGTSQRPGFMQCRANALLPTGFSVDGSSPRFDHSGPLENMMGLRASGEVWGGSGGSVRRESKRIEWPGPALEFVVGAKGKKLGAEIRKYGGSFASVDGGRDGACGRMGRLLGPFEWEPGRSPGTQKYLVGYETVKAKYSRVVSVSLDRGWSMGVQQRTLWYGFGLGLWWVIKHEKRFGLAWACMSDLRASAATSAV